MTENNVQTTNPESLTTITEWVENHWNEFLADLESLISIASIEDTQSASANAPWGKAPLEALLKTLEIAERLGFTTTNLNGAIGYGDIAGKSEKQLAIIGHTDVVPAGSGWDFEPFALTKKDGYLIGRGVIDDKGPLLCALYALAYYAQTTNEVPYTLRAIIGANEETGMGDLAVYQKHCSDPEFLFTPDSNWPLIYGEKGMWQAHIKSAPIEGGHIIEWAGGSVANAVPGTAHALVRVPAAFDTDKLPHAENITVKLCTHDAHPALSITTQGKSAHASTPELGRSAINMLAHYILDLNLLIPGFICTDEQAFLELVARLSDTYDGESVGLNTTDESFGALTFVAGLAAKEGSALTQTIDIRYPTSIDKTTIEHALSALVQTTGASLEVTNAQVPFLMNPSGPEITALMDAYKQVTGDKHEPFTIGGGTYARHFKNAVSFGMEKSWQKEAEWVGGMHGPNEAVREADMKEAMIVYIKAIQNLCKIEF